jgi:hypothetical protein
MLGRLTLNMLLYFAQFEREVTAERIRDKVAAFRRKGMRTGGVAPYGYQVQNRKLLVDEAAAGHVRWIFGHFLEIGSCAILAPEVEAKGVRTSCGNQIENKNLYWMLSNCADIGVAVHKGNSQPGEHDAIIDRGLWGRMQLTLKRAVFLQPEIASGTWKATRAHDSGVTEADAIDALLRLDPQLDEPFPIKQARIRDAV